MKSFLNPINRVGILLFLTMLYIIHVQTSNQRIISGSKAAIGQFPWHVLIKLPANNGVWSGGSIISENWVLVAAHCISNQAELLLIFGTIDRDHYENGINMTCSKFLMHPEYDKVNINNDIGLIELPSPLTFTINIQAIDLVTAAEASAANDFVGAETIISGFGKVNNFIGSESNTLLWAQLEVISNSRCLELYNNPKLIVNSTLCAIGWNDTNKSPCHGDSGGPLIWKNKSNKFVQIGIDSFVAQSIGCASKFPAGFTRVSSFLGYIRNITGLNLE
ncbi:collagenase-like [Lucilia sericata]|uniref:collagenase-like n=1 Tax=Lucilia sericata TaxID=13632 RepID=UPI0018A82D36|nr:collagenase-like [Lucilia sericata]